MKFSVVLTTAVSASTVAAQYYYVGLGYNQNSLDTVGVAGRPERVEGIRKDIDTLGAYEMGVMTFAMIFMQNEARSSPRSYAQVAGIHGLPYESWDNTAQRGSGPMCPHNQAMFAIWHRPYLRCFETRLRQWVYALCPHATTDTLRAQCLNVYKTCGLPYWNWLKPSIPALLSGAQITVRSPYTNQPVTVRNPWAVYAMPAGQQNYARPDGRGAMTQTYRNTDWVSRVLGARASLLNQVRDLFRTSCTPHNCACTTNSAQWEPEPRCSGPNLEGIHNSIHASVGGTMNSLALSSYDPIFWLHHCFIDLIWEIWQRTNQGCSNSRLGHGNTNYIIAQDIYQYPRGTRMTRDMQLLPFRIDIMGQHVVKANQQEYNSNNYVAYDVLRGRDGIVDNAARTWALNTFLGGIRGRVKAKRSTTVFERIFGKRQAAPAVDKETIKDTVDKVLSNIGNIVSDVKDAVADTLVDNLVDVGQELEKAKGSANFIDLPDEAEKQEAGLSAEQSQIHYSFRHIAERGVATEQDSSLVFLYKLSSKPLDKDCVPVGNNYVEELEKDDTIGSTMLMKGMKPMEGMEDDMSQIKAGSSISIDGTIIRLISHTKALNETSAEAVVPLLASFVCVKVLTMEEPAKDVTEQVMKDDRVTLNLLQTNITASFEATSKELLDFTDSDAVKVQQEKYMANLASAAADAKPATTTGTATATATATAAESASTTPEPDTSNDDNTPPAVNGGRAGTQSSPQDAPVTDNETTGQDQGNSRQASTNAGSPQADTPAADGETQ